MRRLVCALGLLAAADAARADEARLAPAVGAILTYRMVSTVKTPTLSLTSGEIYAYVITKSDGVTAEGTVKPLAMIYGCAESDARPDCVTARKAPGSRREGDLIVVPVAADVGDSLVKQSAFKLRWFIIELRKAAFPGPKNPGGPDTGEMGLDPAFVATTSMACDTAGMQNFLPFGRAPRVSLPCKQSVTRRPGPNSAVPPLDATHDVSMEFADEGADHVALPSGDWDVRRIAVKISPSDPAQPALVGGFDFSTKLGVAVRTRGVTTSGPEGATVVTTSSELIAVKP